MDKLTWIKPYRMEGKWIERRIIFEDNEIFASNNEELSKRITAMLNGAYNLGRFHEILNKEK